MIGNVGFLRHIESYREAMTERAGNDRCSSSRTVFFLCCFLRVIWNRKLILFFSCYLTITY